MTIRIVPTAIVLMASFSFALLNAACRGRSIPACTVRAAPTEGWQPRFTRDSVVSFLAPSSYHLDTLSGPNVWRNDRHDRWIVISTFRARPPQATQPFWPLRENAVGSDAQYVEDQSTCSRPIGGAPAVIQSGLVSGGVVPAHRAPGVQSLWSTGLDTLAVYFRGEAHDRRGQEELFIILNSIRFHIRAGQSR